MYVTFPAENKVPYETFYSVCLSVSHRCLAFAYVNAQPTHFPAQKIDKVAAQYSVRWAKRNAGCGVLPYGISCRSVPATERRQTQCIIVCQNRQ